MFSRWTRRVNFKKEKQYTSHTRKISLTDVEQTVVSAQAKWGRKRHWQQTAGRSPYEEQLEEVKGRRDPIDRGRWEGPQPTHFTAFPVPVALSSELTELKFNSGHQFAQSMEHDWSPPFMTILLPLSQVLLQLGQGHGT